MYQIICRYDQMHTEYWTGLKLPLTPTLFASLLETYSPTDERILVGIKSLGAYPDGPDRIQDEIVEQGSRLPSLKLVKASKALAGAIPLLVRFRAIVDIPYTTNTAMSVSSSKK